MGACELESKVKELRELQALIDEAQAEAEALKDVIKAYMGENEEIRAGEYKITWKLIKSSKFDTAAFKSTHAELYKQYTKEIATRRFCVA